MAWKSALNILHVWCYEWPDICRSAHAPVTLVTSCNHRGFRRCRSQMKVTRRWNGRIINKWGIVHCHVCWRVYFIPLVGVFIHFAATLSFTFGITIAVEQLCNLLFQEALWFYWKTGKPQMARIIFQRASERERENFRVAGSVWCSRILWILWMQATVSLWTLACSSAC